MDTDNLRIETFLHDLQSFYNDIENIVRYYEDTKDVILVEKPNYSIIKVDETDFTELKLSLLYKKHHIRVTFTPEYKKFFNKENPEYTIRVKFIVKFKDTENDYFHIMSYRDSTRSFIFRQLGRPGCFKKLIEYSKEYWKFVNHDNGKLNKDTFLDFLNHIVCLNMSTVTTIFHDNFLLSLLRIIHTVTEEKDENIVNFEHNYNLLESFYHDYKIIFDNMESEIKLPTIN